MRSTKPDVLFVADAVYAEPGNGDVFDFAILVGWLGDATHPCRTVETGRFEPSPGRDLRAYHNGIAGVRRAAGPRGAVTYARHGVTITAIETLHDNVMTPDLDGTEPFRAALI